MKARIGIVCLPVLLLLVTSCGGESSGDGEKAKNEKKESTQNCEIASMTFEMGRDMRTLEFHYGNGVLQRIETYENGANKNSTMAYSFDKQGKLTSFLSGSVIAKYVYNDEGKIISINGERGISTRTYSYNDHGQIIKQVTEFGGNLYITHEYEYDADGQPVKVNIYNKDGELTEVNELKYDDKINPFKNKGTFVNSMEMLLGYPVGNQNHNIIAIKKIHKMESAYTVNGKKMMPGDIEDNEISYKYNAGGYPVELSRMRNGKKTVMKIEYNCN